MVLVRTRGVEPPWAEAHQILSLARLPIPPRPRSLHVIILYIRKILSDFL